MNIFISDLEVGDLIVANYLTTKAHSVGLVVRKNEKETFIKWEDEAPVWDHNNGDLVDSGWRTYTLIKRRSKS